LPQLSPYPIEYENRVLRDASLSLYRPLLRFRLALKILLRRRGELSSLTHSGAQPSQSIGRNRFLLIVGFLHTEPHALLPRSSRQACQRVGLLQMPASPLFQSVHSVHWPTRARPKMKTACHEQRGHQQRRSPGSRPQVEPSAQSAGKSSPAILQEGPRHARPRHARGKHVGSEVTATQSHDRRNLRINRPAPEPPPSQNEIAAAAETPQTEIWKRPSEPYAPPVQSILRHRISDVETLNAHPLENRRAGQRDEDRQRMHKNPINSLNRLFPVGVSKRKKNLLSIVGRLSVAAGCWRYRTPAWRNFQTH